ncbi:MAG: DUF1007 family protein [Pseudomonadota bacterium]
MAITPKLAAFAAAAFFAVSTIPASTATAHPHAWIDVTVEVLFNDDGAATGLRERWQFDEFYTAFALEGLGTGGAQNPTQEELDEIVRVNVTNIESYYYFTEVEHAGVFIGFDTSKEMSAVYEDNRLEMIFVVPFEEPLDMSTSSLTYGIFDPTYYIEMLHAPVDQPVVLVNAPRDCSAEIEEASPTFEAISLAATVDQMDSTGLQLGTLFAERVTVACS